MATGDDNYWATPGEGLESAFSGNVLSDLLYDNLETSWAKQDYDLSLIHIYVRSGGFLRGL